MGKMREKTKPLQPNCNGCKESEELICRYNARVFDPCVYLRVCYCGENFKRTWVPDEALGECRFALDYHITGLEETTQMREDVYQWAGQVGGLQEAEPSRRVDILNVQMRIKTEKDSMGSGQQAEVESEEVPLVREDGAEVRVLCGRWKDKVGPLEGLLAPETSFLDITLLPGAGESFPLRPQNNSWIYVFGGKGTFGRTGRKKFGRRTFLHINGSEAYVSTRCEGVRFLLFSAPRTEKELKNCTNGRAHICKATGIDFGNKKE